jgi:hypothetical protein
VLCRRASCNRVARVDPLRLGNPSQVFSRRIHDATGQIDGSYLRDGAVTCSGL